MDALPPNNPSGGGIYSSSSIEPQHIITDLISSEIFLQIFSYLDKKSLFNSILVCKKWSSLAFQSLFLYIERIVCIVKKTLVDAAALPIGEGKIKSQCYIDSKNFVIGHDNGSISSWKIHSDSSHRQRNSEMSFLVASNHSPAQNVYFLEAKKYGPQVIAVWQTDYEMMVYSSSGLLIKESIELKGTHAFCNENGDVYVSCSRKLMKLDLENDEVGYKEAWKLKFEEFNIGYMVPYGSSIVAACNSARKNKSDNFTSCVKWFDLDGREEKTLFPRDEKILFLNFSDSKKQGSEKIYISYASKLIFTHDFTHNKNTSIQLDIEVNNNDYIALAPFGDYVFAYVPNSHQNKVLILDSALFPCYLLDMSSIMSKDDSLLNVYGANPKEKEFFVTTSTKILSCMFSFEDDGQDMELTDGRAAKRPRAFGL